MRVQGWEMILAKELKSARNLKFCWGENDCASWALTVRSKLLGRPDLLPEWIGKYNSHSSAIRYMRERGWLDVNDLASEILGKNLGLALLANRGDIVLVGGALGVCSGAVSFFLGVHGLVERKTSECSKAWRT